MLEMTVEWACAHSKWAYAHSSTHPDAKSSKVPTGIPIRDIRDQLFDAAERVLLRDGPSALTSRAVTTEAGVAKGILHRHFPDFDAFLAALVLTHIERLDAGSRSFARRPEPEP